MSRLLRLPAETDEMLKPAAGFFPQRSARREQRLLFEIAEPRRRMQLDGPRIHLLGARQNLKQRRLPSPVRPDQSDPLAGPQLKRHAIQAPAPARNA